ncbi:hypothetical protein LZ190_21155 [Rhodovulum sulfidophilum]|nr:hypothetical protein [Rhodovulum sulfidophilum]
MALILHVGDGKCGSSALQDSLHISRDYLLDKGFLYETGPKRRNHFLVGNLLGKKTRSLEANQDTSAREILEAVAQRSKGVSHTIISSENLFLTNPDKVLSLLRDYKIDTTEIYVIAYVREPTSMYASLIQQELKASYRFQRPQDYCRPIDRFASLWKDAVGADSFDLRLFDRKRLVEGSIISDFTAWLNQVISGAGINLPRRESNGSVSAEQLISLQRMRKDLPNHIEGKFHPKSNAIISAFMQMNKSGIIGNKVKLNHATRETILLKNTGVAKRINDMVKEDFFPVADQATKPSHNMKGVEQENVSDVSVVLDNVDTNLVELFSRVITDQGATSERSQLVLRSGENASKREAVLRGLTFLDESVFTPRNS